MGLSGFSQAPTSIRRKNSRGRLNRKLEARPAQHLGALSKLLVLTPTMTLKRFKTMLSQTGTTSANLMKRFLLVHSHLRSLFCGNLNFSTFSNVKLFKFARFKSKKIMAGKRVWIAIFCSYSFSNSEPT